MTISIMNDFLKTAIRDAGLKQKDIATDIGMDPIHFNKVLNKKASLTPKFAHQLANYKEGVLGVREQDLLFPPLDLELIGQFWSGTKVEMFQFDRPTLKIPTAIRTGSIGIVFRGNEDRDTDWRLKFGEGLCYVFNTENQRKKIKNPLGYGTINLIQRDTGDYYIGWLGKPDKNEKHMFTPMYATTTLRLKIEWNAIFEGSVNLKAAPDIMDNDSIMHIE